MMATFVKVKITPKGHKARTCFFLGQTYSMPEKVAAGYVAAGHAEYIKDAPIPEKASFPKREIAEEPETAAVEPEEDAMKPKPRKRKWNRE
jgi:hypothetical protein